MTNWLIMFKWSASTCASNLEVMVGVIIVDDAFEAASALCTYCPCSFVWRPSFPIPLMTCCFVVALAM
jgi:hypothetical protein